jgi:outer membrane protein TolC
MPATEEAVSTAIAPMSREELALAAASLHHPRLPPVTIPEDGSLTPQAAAVVAVLQSPTLRAARARRGVAAAQLVQAGILPNPQLSGSMDFPIAGATDGTVNAFGIGATWDVTSLIGREAAMSAARHGAEAVDLEIAWQEWQTALAAKLHATRVLWLSQQREELARQAEEATSIAREAETSAEEGLVTVVERDAAGALAQRRRVALYAAEAALRSESSLLRQSLGLPSGTRVVVTDPGDASAPPARSLEEQASTIDQSRLDLAALRAGYAAQEEKVRGAILSQFPKIGLGLTRARDTTDVGTIGFGITLDLPIFDRGQGRIAMETATRQQLFDELAARTFEARADVARAYEDLEAVAIQIAEAEGSVDRLSKLANSLEAARREGLTDIVQLNQARNDLGEAKVEALKARQQEAELRLAVEVATGRLLGGPGR